LAQVPLLPAESTQRIYSTYEGAARSLGQTPSGKFAGYTSDANHLAATGMQLLVGMGPYGEGMHTDSEFMSLESFTNRLSVTTVLIRKLLNER
jgi:glutamate carboxypeptidase